MTTSSARLRSIDVFRGLTVALMIVVNTPGDWGAVYPPLLHAAWNGLTPTDLVFPTFLFIVGASMSFSFDAMRQSATSDAVRRIARRTLLIFLIGVLLNWFPFVHANAAGGWTFKPWSEVRIPGVLQRIALCYGAAALLLLRGGVRTAWLTGIAALIGYWALLQAGGDGTLAGNAVRRLDLLLFGVGHIYHGEGIAFDPEGLLSTLPAIANVLAGWLAGRFVRASGARGATVLRLAVAGAVVAAVALAWNYVLPVNKKLWTSSYALLAIGLDLLLFGLLLWVVDVRRETMGVRFFEVFGRNALFIYLLSEVGVILLVAFHAGPTPLYTVLYEAILGVLHDPRMASLTFAIAAMLSCWVVARALDRRRIYVRL
jgi:predicted acyltransferase